MRYAVVFERTQTGWSCYAPDLPGVIATGETLDETRTRMSEALALHIDGIHQDGAPVPDPVTQVDFVTVAHAAGAARA